MPHGIKVLAFFVSSLNEKVRPGLPICDDKYLAEQFLLRYCTS